MERDQQTLGILQARRDLTLFCEPHISHRQNHHTTTPANEGGTERTSAACQESPSQMNKGTKKRLHSRVEVTVPSRCPLKSSLNTCPRKRVRRPISGRLYGSNDLARSRQNNGDKGDIFMPHAMVLLIFRASHPETLTAHSSHHCPRLRENATKNNKKLQFDIQNSSKYLKILGKSTD